MVQKVKSMAWKTGSCYLIVYVDAESKHILPASHAFQLHKAAIRLSVESTVSFETEVLFQALMVERTSGPWVWSRI